MTREPEEKDIPALYAEVAPYLTHPREMLDLIKRCMEKENPKRCLQDHLRDAEGTMKVDIRIAMDRLTGKSQ